MAAPEVTASLKLRDDMSPALHNATQAVGGFSSFVSQAGATMVGFLGAQVVNNINNFIAGSVAAAAESEKLVAQTSAVIRSTGGAAHVTARNVDELANAISRYSGVDDEAIKNGENLLLTFTHVRNEAGKGNDIFNRATKIMVDMSKALGTDASGSAIQLGKALNDPIKGITALTRVGVTFSDEQKKQIKNFMAHNDIMGAQKVILGELTREFGGSAQAYGDSSAGMMDKMRTAVGNAQEALGSLILILVGQVAPAITTVAQAVQDWFEGNAKVVGKIGEMVKLGLQRFFGDLRDVIREVGDRVRPLAGWLNDVKGAMSGEFLAGFQWFVDHKDTVAVGLLTFTATITTLVAGGKVIALAGEMRALAEGFRVASEAEGLLAAITAVLGGPIGIIAVVVAGLVTAVYALYQNVPEVRDALNALGSWIMSEGVAAFGALQELWKDMQPAVEAVMTTVLGVLDQLSPAFADLMVAVDEAKDQLQVLWDVVQAELVPALLELWDAMQPLVDELVRALRPAFDNLVPSLKLVIGAFIAVVYAGIEVLAFIVKLVTASINTVTAMIRVKDAIVGAAIEMFVQTGDKIAAIIVMFRALPVRVAQIGRDLVAGLKQGIVDAWSAFVAWLTGLIRQLPDPLRAALGIHSPSTVMDEVGRNFIAGLRGGIWSGMVGLLGVIGSWAGQVIGAFKAAFGIHSPSTLMREQGGDLSEGLMLGIKDSWGRVQAVVGDLGLPSVRGLADMVPTNAWDALVQQFAHLPLEARRALGNVSAALYGAGEDLVGGLLAGVRASWAGMRADLQVMLTALTRQVKIGSALDLGRNLVVSLMGGVVDVVPDLRALVQNLLAGLRQGLLDRWTALTTTLRGLIELLVAPLRAAFSLRSGRQMGLDFTTGLRAGLLAGLPGLQGQIDRRRIGPPSAILAGTGGFGSGGGPVTELHLHIDKGAFIDGVGIDLLTNAMTERLRSNPAT